MVPFWFNRNILWREREWDILEECISNANCDCLSSIMNTTNLTFLSVVSKLLIWKFIRICDTVIIIVKKKLGLMKMCPCCSLNWWAFCYLECQARDEVVTWLDVVGQKLKLKRLKPAAKSLIPWRKMEMLEMCVLCTLCQANVVFQN